MQIGNRGTEIVDNYPVSLTASGEARCSELGHAHSGYLLRRKEGREGRTKGREGRKDKRKKVLGSTPGVIVRNLFSRERIPDQDRMPEKE